MVSVFLWVKKTDDLGDANGYILDGILYFDLFILKNISVSLTSISVILSDTYVHPFSLFYYYYKLTLIYFEPPFATK